MQQSSFYFSYGFLSYQLYQWYQREECYWCYPFEESGDTVWEKGFIRKTVEERIKNAAKTPTKHRDHQENELPENGINRDQRIKRRRGEEAA